MRNDPDIIRLSYLLGEKHLRTVVLRLGHRPGRDKRITTHVALTARAFGADATWLSAKDPRIVDTVEKVVTDFGGPFEIKTGVPWRNIIKEWSGTSVHLTMYGMPISSIASKIESDNDMLIVVGAEKVPKEVYTLVDHNISIGNQPHSEVSALAIFLDRLTGRKGLKKDFNGRKKVIPTGRGKKVIETPDKP